MVEHCCPNFLIIAMKDSRRLDRPKLMVELSSVSVELRPDKVEAVGVREPEHSVEADAPVRLVSLNPRPERITVDPSVKTVSLALRLSSPETDRVELADVSFNLISSHILPRIT